MRARRKIACVNTPCGVLGLPAGRAVSTSRGRALARKHCGDMKRPVVHITLRDAAGNVLHSETRSAFNSGVRASEAAVREIARKRGMTYAGDRPTTTGDRFAHTSYARRWVGRDGHVIIASIVMQQPEYGSRASRPATRSPA
jgi:hypothetical protein